MSSTSKITILADTQGAHQYLQEIVSVLGLEPHEGKDDEIASLHIKGDTLTLEGARLAKRTVRLPIPPAELLEFLQSAFAKRMLPRENIAIGAYILNAHDGMLISEVGEDVRLTEKEVAILICLHEAGGKIVGREKLLDSVWGYADNVETHTLETHIYRLRQKIEMDPSDPKILLTQEAGYALTL
jgi:DNA-binding response OmpR family regulator